MGEAMHEADRLTTSIDKTEALAMVLDAALKRAVNADIELSRACANYLSLLVVFPENPGGKETFYDVNDRLHIQTCLRLAERTHANAESVATASRVPGVTSQELLELLLRLNRPDASRTDRASKS